LVDVLARLKWERKTLVAGGLAVLLLATVATHARAAVWADPLTLWQDTVRESPGKWRPHFQLGFAYYNQAQHELAAGDLGLTAQHCGQAVQEFTKTTALHPADADVFLDWGLAYDCLNQPEQALEKLKQSAVMHPTAHVFSQIGMVYGKLEKWPDALAALARAEKLDPTFSDTYVYLGVVHTKNNQLLNAAQDFRHALELDPYNSRARQFLQAVASQLRATPGKQ